MATCLAATRPLLRRASSAGGCSRQRSLLSLKMSERWIVTSKRRRKRRSHGMCMPCGSSPCSSSDRECVFTAPPSSSSPPRAWIRIPGPSRSPQMSAISQVGCHQASTSSSPSATTSPSMASNRACQLCVYREWLPSRGSRIS